MVVKLWGPLTVAFADSVIVLAETVMIVVPTVMIVVPTGMPVPTIVSPATRPVMLLMPVTDGDPIVSVPVKT